MNKFICLVFVFLLWGCGTPKDIENIGYNNLNFDSQKIKDKTPIKKEYNKRCVFMFLCDNYKQSINYDNFIYNAIKDANKQGIKGNAITDIQIDVDTYYGLLIFYFHEKITLTGNIFEKE